MAIDFPNTPVIGDVYSANGRSWKWNGTTWDTYNDATAPMPHGVAHSSSGSDPVALAQSQVTNLTTDLGNKASASALTSHINLTTNVHGISNSASLVYTDDSRLSNPRTPIAHASSHGTGQSDAITIAQSQVTDLTTALAAKADSSSVALASNFPATAWSSYTPTLTSSGVALVLGSGYSADGAYIVYGKTCHWRARIAFGTTGQSAGTGDYRVGLPQTAKSILGTVGGGYIFDASTNDVKTVVCDPVNGALDKAYMRLTVGNYGLVRSDTPWTWAASDYLIVAGSFEIA